MQQNRLDPLQTHQGALEMWMPSVVTVAQKDVPLRHSYYPHCSSFALVLVVTEVVEWVLGQVWEQLTLLQQLSLLIRSQLEQAWASVAAQTQTA